MLAINLVEAQPWPVLHPSSHGFSKEFHYQQATTPRGLLDMCWKGGSAVFINVPSFSSLQQIIHQSWAHLAIRLLHTNRAKGSSLGLAMALPLLDSKLAHTPSGWNRGIVVVAVGLHSPYSSCTSRCRLQRWDGAVSKRLLVAKELRCNGCICSSAEKSQQHKGKHCTNTAQYSINGTNTLRSIVECSVKLDAKLHISNTYHILMQANLYCV